MTSADLLALLQGASLTLALSAVGIAIGLPAGLALALVRWAKVPLASPVVAVAVSGLRATPLVTLILLLFFALPVAGIDLGPVAAGVLALSLNTAAFNCEIWRAALDAFPPDQTDAARAFGMRRHQLLRHIVLPQIVRAALPGLVNEMSLLIKLTPALAIVGVVETTRAAVRIGARTYEPLPPILVAVVLYVPIVYGLLVLQGRLERRLATADAEAR